MFYLISGDLFIIMEKLVDEKISKFYDIASIKYFDDVQKYFTITNSYNWKEIALLLEADFVSDGIVDYNKLKYEDFLRIVDKLRPIYIASTKVSVDFNSTNFKFLGSWHDPLIEFERTNLNEFETKNVEYILLLTAALEFSLGNIYSTLTQGNQPPHLLKDLLNSEELLHFFGRGAIWFLKVLLGTPNAVNLRNVVWHGFPQPAEIPQYFVSVLFVSIHTLGHQIQSQKLNLLKRSQVEDLSRYLIRFERFVQRNCLVQHVSDAVISCTWISLEHKKFWIQLFKYYNTEKYWQFIILVLPQIELLLRLIYAQLNNYDIRAKLDKYYITMDTIFESKVPPNNIYPNVLLISKSNKHLSQGCLKLMYDFFVAPQGPRLRDKVSHGEVTLECLKNPVLCSILLQLSLSLFNFGKSTCALTNYECQFHLNSLARQSINDAKLFLLSLTNLPLVKKFEFSTTDNENLKNPLTLNIEIFQRHNKEAEIINLIIKISQSITLTCKNYEESVTLRVQLLQQRELHSKRRKTLEKMLESLPAVWKTLCSIINCIEILFVRLQQDDEMEIFKSSERFFKTVRFLKHTLQCSENFIKYSEKGNNEWLKALELCKKFERILESFF